MPLRKHPGFVGLNVNGAVGVGETTEMTAGEAAERATFDQIVRRIRLWHDATTTSGSAY
jgi:hypothetical protein